MQFNLLKEGSSYNFTTWMNLKGTVLSERSQSQKDKSCMIPLIKTECRMELSGAEGQRNGILFSGYKRVFGFAR